MSGSERPGPESRGGRGLDEGKSRRPRNLFVLTQLPKLDITLSCDTIKYEFVY